MFSAQANASETNALLYTMICMCLYLLCDICPSEKRFRSINTRSNWFNQRLLTGRGTIDPLVALLYNYKLITYVENNGLLIINYI